MRARKAREELGGVRVKRRVEKLLCTGARLCTLACGGNCGLEALAELADGNLLWLGSRGSNRAGRTEVGPDNNGVWAQAGVFNTHGARSNN